MPLPSAAVHAAYVPTNAPDATPPTVVLSAVTSHAPPRNAYGFWRSDTQMRASANGVLRANTLTASEYGPGAAAHSEAAEGVGASHSAPHVRTACASHAPLAVPQLPTLEKHVLANTHEIAELASAGGTRHVPASAAHDVTRSTASDVDADRSGMRSSAPLRCSTSTRSALAVRGSARTALQSTTSSVSSAESADRPDMSRSAGRLASRNSTNAGKRAAELLGNASKRDRPEISSDVNCANDHAGGSTKSGKSTRDNYATIAVAVAVEKQ